MWHSNSHYFTTTIPASYCTHTTIAINYSPTAARASYSLPFSALDATPAQAIKPLLLLDTYSALDATPVRAIEPPAAFILTSLRAARSG